MLKCAYCNLDIEESDGLPQRCGCSIHYACSSGFFCENPAHSAPGGAAAAVASGRHSSASSTSSTGSEAHNNYCLECKEEIQLGQATYVCRGKGCGSKGCGSVYHQDCVGVYKSWVNWSCKNPICDCSQGFSDNAHNAILAAAMQRWYQENESRMPSMLQGFQGHTTFAAPQIVEEVIRRAAQMDPETARCWWGRWTRNEDFQRQVLAGFAGLMQNCLSNLDSHLLTTEATERLAADLRSLATTPGDKAALRRVAKWAKLFGDQDGGDDITSENMTELMGPVFQSVLGASFAGTSLQLALAHNAGGLPVPGEADEAAAPQRTLCSRLLRMGVPVATLGGFLVFSFVAKVIEIHQHSTPTPAPTMAPTSADFPPPLPSPTTTAAPATSGTVFLTLFSALVRAIGLPAAIVLLVILIIGFIVLFLALNAPAYLPGTNAWKQRRAHNRHKADGYESIN